MIEFPKVGQHGTAHRTKWWTFCRAKAAGWANSLTLLSRRTTGKRPMCITPPGSCCLFLVTRPVTRVNSLNSRPVTRVLIWWKLIWHILDAYEWNLEISLASCFIMFHWQLRGFKVSFKCIAKRCRLLSLEIGPLHKAILESGLAEVSWRTRRKTKSGWTWYSRDFSPTSIRNISD